VGRALNLPASQISIVNLEAGSVIVHTKVSGLHDNAEVERVTDAVNDSEGPVQHVIFLGFGTTELHTSASDIPTPKKSVAPAVKKQSSGEISPRRELKKNNSVIVEKPARPELRKNKSLLIDKIPIPQLLVMVVVLFRKRDRNLLTEELDMYSLE